MTGIFRDGVDTIQKTQEAKATSDGTSTETDVEDLRRPFMDIRLADRDRKPTADQTEKLPPAASQINGRSRSIADIQVASCFS